MGLILTPVSEIPAATRQERHSHEAGFRRGYWHGVLAACNHILSGATQHDVRLWLFREVKDWRVRLLEDSCEREEPPACCYGRSYDEATLRANAPKPLPSGDKCFVYAIGDGHGHVKIGIASDVTKRLCALQTGNASRLYLICYVQSGSRSEAERIEEWCHKDLREHRACGEWFRVFDDVAFQSLFECMWELEMEYPVVEIENRVY